MKNLLVMPVMINLILPYIRIALCTAVFTTKRKRCITLWVWSFEGCPQCILANACSLLGDRSGRGRQSFWFYTKVRDLQAAFPQAVGFPTQGKLFQRMGCAFLILFPMIMPSSVPDAVMNDSGINSGIRL